MSTCNQPGGLVNTRTSTGYAQKSPWTLVSSRSFIYVVVPLYRTNCRIISHVGCNLEPWFGFDHLRHTFIPYAPKSNTCTTSVVDCRNPNLKTTLVTLSLWRQREGTYHATSYKYPHPLIFPPWWILGHKNLQGVGMKPCALLVMCSSSTGRWQNDPEQ